jgi:hypothetical protein
MVALLCFVMAVLAAPFKSKSHLEAENAALRHQLIILRRKVPGRVQLTNNDRWFFIQLYRWFPSILQFLCVPKTPFTTPELAGLRWLAWRRLVSSSSPSATFLRGGESFVETKI